MSNSTLVGLMPVPPGETADFNVHHITTTQAQFIIAYAVTLALATISLVMRLYTRIFIIRAFGLDDGMLPSWIIVTIADELQF
jgi:hypothetical protein